MRRIARRLRAALALLLAAGPGLAQAANYTFPGNLPAGCSGSSGSYTCTSLTLGYLDTLTVSTTTTITVTGDLTTNTSQINASGPTNQLTFVVGGTVTINYQAVLNANVTAGAVTDANGSASVGGSLTTTSGNITLGFNTSVGGSVSTTSGVITLNQGNVVGGSVTSSTGAITIGYQGQVAGSVSTAGTITLGQEARVSGSVSSASNSVDVGYGARVTGSVTASGSVALGSTAQVQACVQSRSSSGISLAWAATAGGVCCGSSSCSSSCVSNNSGAAMPALCNLVIPVAEYRLEESTWNGTAGEIVDSSGNARHARRVGSAAASASGYVCRGGDVPADTSNTSSAIDTGIDVDTTIGSSGTISFWYRGNGVWGSGNDLQLFDASTSSNRSFHLVRRGNGSLRFAVTDSGGSTMTAASSNLSYAAGTWVHIAVTWKLVSGSNASSLAIYVDGSSVASAAGTTTGTLHSTIGTLYVGDSRANITSNNATINSADGRFDELRLYSGAQSASEIASDRAVTRTCASSLHHVELQHGSGAGLTCAPSTLTLVACQDSACATPYTGGLTGTVTSTGTGMTVNWPGGSGFSIASGSSSTTLQLQLTTAGSVVLGTTGLSASASNATSCNFGSPACTYTAADAGFVFDVPHHVAETSQAVTVSAVKKSDTSQACVPAFASTTKAVTFSCSYTNPASGTLPVRVGGSALNSGNSSAAACDAGGRAVNLAFNASGVASTAVQYADVGRLTLGASYSGSGNEAGLVMTGSDSFVAAPSTFAFSSITAGPIRAGTAFAATVSARNSAGSTAPNFGRESPAEGVTLAFVRRAPTGSGASDGSFSGSVGSFSNGSASSANLVWSEVGSGDLTATLASGSYLGSGLGASGSTGTAGAVGRFIPHHFDVAVTPACGAFSYAGQPFGVTVTAKNGLALPGTTLNYDGSAATTPTHAKAVTLTDQPTLGVGSLSGASIAASAFTAGVASATPSYAFSTKTTAPQSLALRAVDTDAVSSAGFAEGSTALRSGRLRLASAFGSEKAALALPARAEYWSGSAWLTNTADSCTTVPAAAVALSNRRTHQGGSGASWSNTTTAIGIAGGLGTLTIGAPAPTASGTVDIALNLGSTGTDQSCLGAHPATTGAARAWLRAANGSCAASADRDPSARASFGIHSPETQRTIHARELF